MAELVGRDGPETIVPTEPGTIIPNDKLALYQQMLDMLRSARTATDPVNMMPQAGPVTGSVLQDLVGSLPLASMGTGARVHLAPRAAGTGTNLRVSGGQGMQFARQPFTGHPGRSAYPAVAAGQLAGIAQTGPPEVVAGPEQWPVPGQPPEQWPVPSNPEPEMGAYRPTPAGVGGESGKRATPESGQGAKKPAKRATQRREPTLMEKLAALLPAGNKPPGRNPTPGGHYQFGGRPPVGWESGVGEDGPEAFVSDREFDGVRGGRSAPTNFPGSLQELFGGGGLANLIASGMSGGRLPLGQTTQSPFTSFLSGLGFKGFEEGGRPEPGEPAMVGEGGEEAFVPDDELHSMIMEATRAPTSPAPQPRMHKGREVADYSKRDPDAEVAQSKQRWADIRDNPAETVSQLGLTGGIIGAAMKHGSTRAEAAPAGGKKAANRTPMDAVREEQTMLAEKGFYKGEIDGADGPETKKAREAYKQHLESEQTRIQQEIEQGKLRAQEGVNLATQKTAETQEKLATAQLEKTKLEKEEAERKAKQRKAGEESLKKAEESTGPIAKFLREWGPMLGYGVGGALGLGSRLGVLKSANKASKEVAEAAEAPFTANLPNTSDRVARVNRFWREGGAGEAVPFATGTATKAGFSPNSKVADLSTLYPAPTRSYLTKDVGIPVAALAESGLGSALAWDAQNRLDAAVAAYNADPTQANIDAIQSAKNYLASFEFMANLGRGAAGGYIGTAAKTSRKPTRPNTSPAEAEKMELEKMLPRQRAMKEKPAQEVLPPPPKQIQAGVPPALGPEAWMARQVAPPAPVQALPPPSMVPPSSLQEMVEPVRQARVPRRTKQPLEREVLERGPSGRPVRTEPFQAGNELAVLESGYEKTMPALLENAMTKHAQGKISTGDVKKLFAKHGWHIDMRRGGYDWEIFDPSGKAHYLTP